MFLACMLSPAAACLDLTPVVLPPPEGGSDEAQEICRACLYTADDPGPGCGSEMAPCDLDSKCKAILACTFERHCYGGDTKSYLACSPACQQIVSRQDDPVIALVLPIYQCVSGGACASACVPAEVSNAGPDAGVAADVSVGDGPSGNACLDPADQAILAAGLGMTPTNCGFNCYTASTADCAIACVQNQTGLSASCSICWGGIIHCGTSKCLAQCLAPDSQDCRDCTAQFCQPAFAACAGTQ
jgi:hypothetical protein